MVVLTLTADLINGGYYPVHKNLNTQQGALNTRRFSTFYKSTCHPESVLGRMCPHICKKVHVKTDPLHFQWKVPFTQRFGKSIEKFQKERIKGGIYSQKLLFPLEN